MADAGVSFYVTLNKSQLVLLESQADVCVFRLIDIEL